MKIAQRLGWQQLWPVPNLGKYNGQKMFQEVLVPAEPPKLMPTEQAAEEGEED